MAKFFKKDPTSIYLIEKVKGKDEVVEIDTDTTPSDASGKIHQIAFGLVGGKIISEDSEHITAEGYTEQGAKVILYADLDRNIDAPGAIDL
jgi:hypothetical protein